MSVESRDIDLLVNGESSVGAGVAQHLSAAHSPGAEAWLATAYFNPSGFAQVASALKAFGGVRILLGTEPDPPMERPKHLERGSRALRTDADLVTAARKRQLELFASDRDLLGFTPENSALIEDLVAWLRSGGVEVKMYEANYMHAKAFIVSNGAPSLIAGSANLTHAGLSKNEEMGLAVDDKEANDQAREWFGRLWEEAKDFDLAAIYAGVLEPHDPWLIWMKILWELYAGELTEEAEGGTIRLAKFQQHGVWRARRILEAHNGVLIADGVGLGKTFTAGALLEDVRERRQRALIVAPAALREGWGKFLHKHFLGFEVISFDQLSLDHRLAPPEKNVEGTVLKSAPEDYSLVVIDEAHALRNPDAMRSHSMRQLLKGSSGTKAEPKKVVLLTATPVNNSLQDLHELLRLFIKDDSKFAPKVPSLAEHFKEAEGVDPDDLKPDRLFDVLDEVAVRRPRRLIKEHYSDDTVEFNGKMIPIRFPTPIVKRIGGYSANDTLDHVFEELEHALGCSVDVPCEHAFASPPLTLARYTPSLFRRDGRTDAYETQLAGLLRSGLLKRFESSVRAFGLTCRRMVESHDRFLEALDLGHVLSGETLRAWKTDTDDLDLLVKSQDNDKDEPASEYEIDKLREATITDREILRDFSARALAVDAKDDTKLKVLIDQLTEIAAQADEQQGVSEERRGDLRKVIVFSYFADTVEWIEEHLAKEMARPGSPLAVYSGRMRTISGNSDASKETVTAEFAPRTAGGDGAKDKCDLLVATDVLAEGVNLQQARNMINYDLPWNPMRLVQRHGRIDRIGSEHEDVDIRCFLDDKLDDYLQLEGKLHDKVKKAAASIGVESEILPGAKTGEQSYSDTREEIDNLEDLLETGGERGDALSAEQYRQELREFLAAAPGNRTMLEDLPWRSGSGYLTDKVDAEEGPVFVFAAKVGDWPGLFLRAVRSGLAVDSAERVDSSTQECLRLARVGEGEPRHLSSETQDAAYGAWLEARESIHQQWDESLRAGRRDGVQIPKAMRDAAAHVSRHLAPGMTVEEGDELEARLTVNCMPRVWKRFRIALASDAKPDTITERLRELANEEGLEKPEPRMPLPAIEPDDVHLVCWMGLEAPLGGGPG